MKNFLLLLFVLLITSTSCEKDNSDNDEPLALLIADSNLIKQLKNYSIDDSNIDFESFNISKDSNYIFFNGIKDNKLYIESYKIETKENILKWEDTNEIKETFTINNHETKLNFRRIRSATRIKDKFIFVILFLPNNDSYFEEYSASLLFLDATNGTNKYINNLSGQCNINYLFSDLISLTQYDGVFKKGDLCYNINGEEKFNIINLISGINKKQKYAYGIDKNNRLCIEAYDEILMRNILSWKSDNTLDTVIHKDLGYNETASHDIEEYEITPPYENNNKFIFTLKNKTSYKYGRSDLYFVTENSIKIQNKAQIDYSGYYGYKPWFSKSILFSYKDEDDFKHLICYSTDGMINYELEKTKYEFYYAPKENYIPVSLSDFIVFGTGINGHFFRTSITKQDHIWMSEPPFPDLENTTRIDSILISKTDDNFVNYDFYCTKYDGTKLNTDFKINIETGEFKKQ